MTLTATQKLIVYGVKDEVAQNLADKLQHLVIHINQLLFRARLQSCTGKSSVNLVLLKLKSL